MMMMTRWILLLGLVVLCGVACEEDAPSGTDDTLNQQDSGTADTGVQQDTSDPQDTQTNGDTNTEQDIPMDTATGDTGTADSSNQDTAVQDTGTADTGTADTGPADTGAADTGPADTGAQDTGTPDTGPTIDDPADWTQCTSNADCVAALGWDLARCNTDWPGGRCTCNDNQTADTCFQLGNGVNTPVCAGDLAAGFFCTYESFSGQECPVWLAKRFFVGDDYCLLKRCSSDSDCGAPTTPFECRSLGGGGGTTYCQNPE